jgi:hypothetical protein
VSVTSSGYGLAKLLTGQHSPRDVGVLLLGLLVGALVASLFVRHHRRRRATESP